jgi:hypothetical protein
LDYMLTVKKFGLFVQTDSGEKEMLKWFVAYMIFHFLTH